MDKHVTAVETVEEKTGKLPDFFLKKLPNASHSLQC